MRVLAILILSMSLIALTSARADPADGSFDVGVWRGSPVSTDGAFAYCGMQAFFGQKDAPVVLSVGLDRLRGWTVSVRSDQFTPHAGRIKAGLAFDNEASTDVRGDVVYPTTISFKFPSTELLDRHLGARKLVLIFSDLAMPFALSGFEAATKALRSCLAVNMASAPEESVTDSPAAPATDPTIAPRAMEPQPANPRLFSEIVAPMMVGFVGSVVLVLFSGAILFQVTNARARSRYLRLWSAEYRSSATRPLTVGLLDPHPAT